MSTTRHRSKKEKSTTPELRFKDFKDEWIFKQLSELLEFKNGVNADKEQYGRGIKFINVLDILSNDFLTYEVIFGSVDIDEDTFKKNIVSFGDILFQRSSETREEVGTACVYLDNKPATFGGFVIRGKKIGDYNPIFFNKLLKTNLARNEITSKSGGSTRYNVGQETLSSVRLPFPSLPEQQKIASFLSAVDEKIQQLTRKKELLDKYKKGVMQQLFSGKLRFKDENGKAYPKWEEKRLGDVAEIKRGAASQHLQYVENENAGIRLLRINDFLSDDPVYVENTDDMKRFTVRTNDLLIAGTGATAGIVFIIPEKFNGLSYSYNAPRIRVNEANHLFIYYYLKSYLILRQQKKLFVGNAQPFLDTDAMRGFRINLPSKEEQQKISSFLTELDVKIESVSFQIKQTQNFKKGLLQQMFV